MNQKDDVDDNINETDSEINATTKSDKPSSNKTSSRLSIPSRFIIGHEITAGVPEGNVPKDDQTLSKPKLKVKTTSESDDITGQNDHQENSTEDEYTELNKDNPVEDSTPLGNESNTPSAEQTTSESALNDTKDNQSADIKKVAYAETTENPIPDSQKLSETIDETTNFKPPEEIDRRKYFVPINAIAHKRSIKVSIGLTILFILLSFILVDLMLDSGIILLLQKIPHTHFFTTST